MFTARCSTYLCVQVLRTLSWLLGGVKMVRVSGFYVGGMVSLMWCYYLFSPPSPDTVKAGNAGLVRSRLDTAFVADAGDTAPQVYGKPEITRFLELWDRVMPSDIKAVHGDIGPKLRNPRFRDTVTALLQREIVNFGPEVKQQFSFLNASYRARVPDAIIIGCRKCGSTFLMDTLHLHPHVAIAPYEVHFFNKHTEYAKGFEYYRSKMAPSFSDQVTMEKSPSYFINHDTPERVHALNPNQKLVLVVRDPACRTISDYYYGIHLGYYVPEEGESLDDVMASSVEENSLKRSLMDYSSYYSSMLLWLQYFPLENFHIIRNEDLLQAGSLRSALYDLESFLGVPHVFNVTTPYMGRVCVRGGMYLPPQCFQSDGEDCKYKSSHPDLLKRLAATFQQEADRFQHLVHRNFNWTKGL